jgi:DNA-binding transcriptional ArsR family regulator
MPFPYPIPEYQKMAVYCRCDLFKRNLYNGAMDAFLAIADPIRREILELLEKGPRLAGEIAAQFSVSPPAISQHLKALRVARLIQVRADAQRRIYALDPKGFEEVQRWLLRYKFFWNAKLDALEDALRAERSRQRAERARSMHGAAKAPKLARSAKARRLP